MTEADNFKPLSAYIVGALRTAGGRSPNGGLSGWHPADLGALVCDKVLEQAGVAGGEVDDVIFGCFAQVGAQAGNIARNVVLSSSKLPETVPGYSMDRMCGSSQQAIHAGAQAVMSGTMDIVLAGGVEVMSTVPILSSVTDADKQGHGLPLSPDLAQKYQDRLDKEYTQFGIGREPLGFSQFAGGELLAKTYDISRAELDAFAARSHQLANAATQQGHFEAEIVPVPVKRKPKKGESANPEKDAAEPLFRKDEIVRPETTAVSLGKLKTLQKAGKITAASSSQICDGAAAVLLCNERGLKKLGLAPRAKLVSLAVAATEPVLDYLGGNIPATQKALEMAKLKMEDIARVEVNEAFASVPLSWAKALTGGDHSKLNMSGGAMALGHPLGATGAKLMTTLLHGLERTQTRYGLLSICGGGTATATIIERLGGTTTAQQSKL